MTAGSEQCDGSGETSLCNSDCTTRSCGDSKINATAGETCDNGANNAADKACNTSCHITTCGDGVVQDPNGNGQTESCEPALDGTCTAQCMYAAGVGISTTTYSTQQTSSTGVRLAPPPNCGNGVLETAKGEFCDDGRFNGLSPHCDRWCHTQFCGDGVVETQNDEECEPPRSADGTLTAASCGNICTVPACDADGVCVGGCKVRFVQCLNSSASSVGSISTVQLSTAGATSSSSSSSSFRDVQQLINQGIQQATSLGGGAGESSSSVQSFILPISLPPGSFTPGNDPFTPSLCGNSQVDPGEECDDGELNSDSRPDACRTNCKKAFCDDGVQDSSEQCDRGAADNQIGNGCTPTCKVSICGNSTLEPGEECDDGPRNSPSMPDSCSALCLLPRCGDGVVDANFGEACDNGVNNSDTKPNGCRMNCAPAHCGDSVKDDNEECDDGPNGSATCSSACILVASDIHPAAPAAAGIPEDSVVPLVFFVLIMIGMTGWRISKMFR